MNYNIALLGIIEVVSAISIGIFILALTYKIVQFVGEKYYGIKEFNHAYSIFTAAIILSVGLMVSGVIQPLISSFRLLNKEEGTLLLAFKYIGTGAVYIAIAYVAAVLIGLISTFLYSKLTPIDEFEEIRKNNIGVAIIVSAILITLTMLSKSGVVMIIEALIPYPQLPPTGF
ncbi:DUF350 domain-containing protein [Marinoscillum sp. MHG1-6]|uniref:DUF350 domain-containing protein n=1 Tax=Marinoscillum sp. MHG1-6 TaxID=2959627 RepID=UPI002157A9CE|nr:DUF350 domain-containing protein [Marinoscillum sp. MHG1-6]